MNTQLAFAFGMLTMVAIIMLVTIIIGMVKAIRHAEQINSLNQQLSNFMDRVLGSTALDELAKEINNRIENELIQVHRCIDETDKLVMHRFDEIQSYTDSRFDKTENRISTKLDSIYNRIDYIEELLKANGITTTMVKPLTIKDIEKHQRNKQLLKD
jgi:predicted PurR-regulated permease PerM